MNITLQFVRPAALSSDMIAWFSQGWLSHVDAVLDGGRLLGAYEGKVLNIPRGVQVRPPKYAKWASVVRFDIPVSAPQKVKWLEFLNSQIGKPYDWQAIAAFALNRNWHDPGAWICSEYQAAALEACNVLPRSLFAPVNKITPVMLATIVSSLSGVTESVLV